MLQRKAVVHGVIGAHLVAVTEKSKILRVSEVATAAENKEEVVGCDKGIRPEWIRPDDVRPYFGIGRTLLYQLIAEGKVKTASFRKRGQKHATRLISYDSMAAYIESLAEGGAP